MRGGERIVDVGVLTVDQSVDHLGCVGCLPGVEAEILQHLHAGNELAQSLHDRRHGQSRVRSSAWPPEVGACRDLRPGVLQVSESGQGRANSELVQDGTISHRYVEVAADNHLPSGEITKIL